jgi:uncharacterized protein (TIGR03435 family)
MKTAMQQSRRMRVAAVVAAAALACGLAQAQAASVTDLTGNWQGTVDVGKGQRIVLQVTKEGDAKHPVWKGLMHQLDAYQPEEGRNTSQMSFEGGAVQFAVASVEVTFDGTLSADGKSMTGRWTERGQTHPLTLARADGDLAWAIPQTKKAMPPNADPDWEVVTVRQGDPNGMNSGIRVEGRDLVVERHSVETLLLFGFGVHKTQVMNAPDWVRSERWDAKGYADVPGQPSIPQFQSLIRKLLVERFGLVQHTEKRDLPVYALTVGKGTLKIEKSAADPNGLPLDNDRDNGGQRTMQIGNMTMHDFCLVMTFYMDKPVVDQTGLTGKYDFLLKYTYDESKVPADGSAPPTIFTAIQEELGLKLEPVKAPTDVMVIDKVERPGAN